MAGLVIAEGPSGRAGHADALAVVGAHTALQLTVDALREAGVPEVVLVLGADAARVVAALRPEPGVRTVMNTAFATGRGGSLRAGLRDLDEGVDAVLVLACELPAPDPDTLRAVVRAAADDPTHPAVTARFDDGDGPPLLLRRGVWPRLMGLRGDAGVEAVLGDRELLGVPVPGRRPA